MDARLPKKKTGRIQLRETSAGGVVYRRVPGGIEFAMTLDPYDKWTFPKGHVEKGEAIEEAAARETIEELGIDEIRMLEPLGKISIWFRDRFVHRGALIHKDIFFFLFEAARDAKLTPQKSEGLKDAAWVPAKDVLKRSAYQDLVPIIKKALAFLRSAQTGRPGPRSS